MNQDAIELGKRVSQIRKEDLKLSQKAFADALKNYGCDIGQSDVAHYEKGDYIPKANFFTALMEAYKYNPYWVRHGLSNKYVKDTNEETVLSEPSVEYNKIIAAPIYGEVFCGAPASQWQSEHILKSIPTDVKDKSAFGVIAKGSSMEPYINDKDILICVDNPHLIKDKSAVVTVFKSEPETTNSNAKLFKRDIKNKNIILYSINTRNPPEIYKESEIIKIYKVVRIIREVK